MVNSELSRKNKTKKEDFNKGNNYKVNFQCFALCKAQKICIAGLRYF